MDPHRNNSLSQIKIKTNTRISTQHAFTIKSRLDNTKPIVESPEQEQNEHDTLIYRSKHKYNCRKLCNIFCHGPIYLQSPLPDRHFLP
eukprot:189350_1